MNYLPDVLIVTVTTVEGAAVCDAFQKANGHAQKIISIGNRNYRDLGVVNGSRIYLAICEMGSGGLGGSQEAVRRAVEVLRPHAVVMVGIAFGMNGEKQNIGDILVSKQLFLYELQRLGTDKIIPRGDKPHASSKLINWISHAVLDWDSAKVTIRLGLMFSGDKLVDDIDYRNQLSQFAEEAIGGEMEGAGLYVACEANKIDWILVKGICDFADGNKSEDKEKRQALAAHNAASFVLHSLQLVPLRREDIRTSEHFKERYSGLVISFRQSYLVSETGKSPFGGRNTELKRLDAWLKEEGPSRLLITGPTGRGKSALLVQWTETIAEPSTQETWHVAFVPISSKFGTNRQTVFYSILASRLATILNESLQPPSVDAEEFYIGTISTMLQKLASSAKKVLVVVDGIDEALGQRFNSTIFPLQLPATTKIVLSARELAGDSGSKGWMRRLSWDGSVRVTTIELAILNKQGVIEVLQSTGLSPREVPDEVVVGLLRLSEGEPLLLRLYAEDFVAIVTTKGQVSAADLEGFHPGFGAYFSTWFENQRRQWKDEGHTVAEHTIDTALAVFACAYGPLAAEHLISLMCRITGHPHTLPVEHIIRPINRFISGGTHERGYVLNHPKLGQYLSEEYFDRSTITKTHLAFANWGREAVESLGREGSAIDETSPYILQYYLEHLGTAGGTVNDYASILSNGWRRAWERYEGSYRGFTESIRTILNRLGPSEKHLQGVPIVVCIRVRSSLCLASVQSIAGNLPIELVELALDDGLLTIPQAIHQIELQLPENQASSFVAILKYLPIERVNEVVRLVEAVPDKFNRAQYLLKIIPHIQADHQKMLANQVLALAEEVEIPVHRLSLWSDILPHLDINQATALATLALSLTYPTEWQGSYARELGKFARFFGEHNNPLADTVITSCLQAFDKSTNIFAKIEVLWDVADILPDSEIDSRIQLLLPHARLKFEQLAVKQRLGQTEITDHFMLGTACQSYTSLLLLRARRLNDEAVNLVVMEVKDIVEQLPDRYDIVRVLTTQIPRMPTRVQAEVTQVCFQLARQLSTGNNRTHALMALARVTPQQNRKDIVSEGLNNARLIEDKYSRGLALVALFSQLTPEEKSIELPVVLNAINQIYYVLHRGEVFIELALHWPTQAQQYFEQGLNLLSMTAGSSFRIGGLINCVGKLPGDLRTSVFHRCLEELLAGGNKSFPGMSMGLLFEKTADLWSKDNFETAYQFSLGLPEWERAYLLSSLVPLAFQFGSSKVVAQTFLAVLAQKQADHRNIVVAKMISHVEKVENQLQLAESGWKLAFDSDPSIGDRLIASLPLLSVAQRKAIFHILEGALSQEHLAAFASATYDEESSTVGEQGKPNPRTVPEQLQALDQMTERSGIPRSTLLNDLGKMASTFLNIGGTALVRRVMHEITENAEWWP